MRAWSLFLPEDRTLAARPAIMIPRSFRKNECDFNKLQRRNAATLQKDLIFDISSHTIIGYHLKNERIFSMDVVTLKHLALNGALQEQIVVSSSALASQLGASPQTAARRLCSLEEEGCIKRTIIGTGQKVKITEKGMLLLQAEYQDYKRIFEHGNPHMIRGVVVGGLGEGQYYISREGYSEQFRCLLGFEPFAGTFNIRLDEPFVPSGLQAIKIEGFRDEGRTFGECKCYRIAVNGIEAAVVRPERSNYPANLIEVLAPVRLRDVLRLADGDPVEVILR